MDTPSASPTMTVRKSGLLLLLALLATLSFGLRTMSTSATWIHLASGRIIAQDGRPQFDPFSFTTASDRPWINANWLYDVSLFKLWNSAGATGLILLNALLGLAALWFALASGPTAIRRPASLFTLLACGWLIGPVFHVAPAMPALALMGLTLFLLSRHAGKPLAWLVLVPVQIIWTNLHGTFFVGPLLALLFGLQAVVLRRRTVNPDNAAPRPLFLLAAALLAVTLVNPYGLGLHRHVLHAFTQPSLGVLIEWISPFQSEFAPAWPRHASTLMLILVAMGFVLIRDRLPMAHTTLAVLGAFLLVMSPRYVAVSALMVAPFCALSLTNLGKFLQNRGAGNTLTAATPVLLIVLSLFTLFYVTSNRYFVRTGSAASFGLGVATEILPTAACEKVISRPDFPERAINLAMDGGYLAWKVPGRRVFTDPRVGVYGSTFYQGLARALLGQPETWTNLLKRWDPGAIILNGSWPGAGTALRRLVEDPGWALVFFDGISAVVVQRTSANEAIIKDLELQRTGLRDLESARLEMARSGTGWRLHPVSPRLLGAGTLYLALGRFAEAYTLYRLVMEHTPAYTTGWVNQGLCELQARRYDDAIASLARATRQRPDSPLAWLWLGKAYEAKGLPAEAAAATSKARALNKGVADAFEQSLQGATNRTGATTSTPPAS